MTHLANLRRITIDEFAHFNSNLFNKSNATLKRIGSIAPGVTPRLNMVGLEEAKQQVVGRAADDQFRQNGVNTVDLNQGENVSIAFNNEYSKPCRYRILPTKYKEYNLSSQISLKEEKLFFTQSHAQRDVILRALRLHLSLCHDCPERATYKYLLNSGLPIKFNKLGLS